MKRRTTACIIFFLVCSSAIAQTDFGNQLNLIIKDSTNRFKNFKAGFKESLGNDSIFYSTFNLEGTIDNTILISNDKDKPTYIMDYYSADIAKSISGKLGRKAADEWKDKILSIVGNDFQLSRLKSKNYPSDYGWSFELGYFSIDVVYVPQKGKAKSVLLLHVSYFHLNNTNEN